MEASKIEMAPQQSAPECEHSATPAQSRCREQYCLLNNWKNTGRRPQAELRKQKNQRRSHSSLIGPTTVMGLVLSLPKELIIEISRHIPVQDLFSVAQLSKPIRDSSNDSEIWEKIFKCALHIAPLLYRCFYRLWFGWVDAFPTNN